MASISRPSPAAMARDTLRVVSNRTLLYDLTIWFWGDAIAVDGLLEAAEVLDDPVPRAHCLRFYQRWARRSLDWRDHLTPGVALLRLADESGDEALLRASRRCQPMPPSSNWRQSLTRTPRSMSMLPRCRTP